MLTWTFIGNLAILRIQISNAKLHTCFARDGARNSDSTPFRNINSDLDLVAVARKVAKDQSGPALALLLGSFWNPAAFGKRRNVTQEFKHFLLQIRLTFVGPVRIAKQLVVLPLTY